MKKDALEILLILHKTKKYVVLSVEDISEYGGHVLFKQLTAKQIRQFKKVLDGWEEHE